MARAIFSAVFLDTEPPVKYRETVLLETPHSWAISMMFMAPSLVGLCAFLFLQRNNVGVLDGISLVESRIRLQTV